MTHGFTHLQGQGEPQAKPLPYSYSLSLSLTPLVWSPHHLESHQGDADVEMMTASRRKKSAS